MRRHSPDWISFTAGLLFVLVGAGYLVATAVHVSVDVRWLAPAVLVGAGAAGLLVALARLRD